MLLDVQGEHLVPRVTDFGLVKGAGQKTMTRPGMVMGTLSYAAPEQLFDTSSAAEPADVWALGVLFYELLSGERPLCQLYPSSAASVLYCQQVRGVLVEKAKRAPPSR